LLGCWEPPFFPRLLVGVLNTGVSGPGGEEDSRAMMGRSDVGSAKDLPPSVVPEVGQGSEYGAKCPHSRPPWFVSQTPRAGFQIARGTGGGGEESAHILYHQQAGTEGFDRTSDVQPQP
jgi:hypothetical protein